MSYAYTSLQDDQQPSSSSSRPLLNRPPIRPLAAGMRPYGDSSLVSSGDSSSSSARSYPSLAGTDRSPAPFSYAPEPKTSPSPPPASGQAGAAPAPGGLAAPAQGLSCPACTYANDPSHNFCAMCNTPLKAKSPSQSPPPAAPRYQAEPAPISSATYAQMPPSQQPSQQYSQPQQYPQQQQQNVYPQMQAIPIPSAVYVPQPQVVYAPVRPVMYMPQSMIYNCFRCGLGYPLPYGATSWRCQCGNFNSTVGDQCNLM